MRPDNATAANDVITFFKISLCVLFLLMAGCSFRENSDDFGVEDEADRLGGVPVAQRVPLVDGRVTFDEYREAVFSYKACMEEQGATFPEFAYDEDTMLFEWLIDTASDAVCYNDELGLIDRSWQAQVYATQAPKREARRVRLVQCLTEEGIEVDPDAPTYVLMGIGIDNGFDIISCP